MRAIWPLPLVAVLTGCGGFDTGLAEAGVDTFHVQFNAGDYQAIIDGAASEFRDSTSAERLARFFATVRAKLGDYRNSGRINVSIFSALSGKKVTLVYRSQFEKALAIETFKFIERDGRALLLSYNINSDAFILDANADAI